MSAGNLKIIAEAILRKKYHTWSNNSYLRILIWLLSGPPTTICLVLDFVSIVTFRVKEQDNAYILTREISALLAVTG